MVDEEKKNICIEKRTHYYLRQNKKPNETFNDVIKRLIEENLQNNSN